MRLVGNRGAGSWMSIKLLTTASACCTMRCIPSLLLLWHWFWLWLDNVAICDLFPGLVVGVFVVRGGLADILFVGALSFFFFLFSLCLERLEASEELLCFSVVV